MNSKDLTKPNDPRIFLGFVEEARSHLKKKTVQKSGNFYMRCNLQLNNTCANCARCSVARAPLSKVFQESTAIADDDFGAFPLDLDRLRF